MTEVRYRPSPSKRDCGSVVANTDDLELDNDTAERRGRLLISKQRRVQRRLTLLGAVLLFAGTVAISRVEQASHETEKNSKTIRSRRLLNLARPQARTSIETETSPITTFIFPDDIRDALYDELTYTKVNTSDLLDLKAFIETSKGIIRRHINDEMIETLLSLHDSRSTTSAVLFKNIPVDPIIPPTPTDGSTSLGKPTHIAEAMLVGLGELTSATIVGYASETEYSNPWIHEGFPRNGPGSALTKASDLSFHQDMSYHHKAPDILGLVCVREGHDRRVSTEIVDNRDAFNLLPTAILNILREPRFQIKTSEWVDPSWSGAGNSSRPIVDDATSIHLSVDWENMVGLDEDAQTALEAMKNAIVNAPKHYIHFVPGDLLLFSNRRVVHARTPYTDLRFDGGDRVLNRAYFLKNLSPEDHLTRII